MNYAVMKQNGMNQGEITSKLFKELIDRLWELGLCPEFFSEVDYDLFITGRATLVVIDGNGFNKVVKVVAHD